MIGILGGSFDPVHNGHLRTAQDVLEILGLDEIRLIPLNNAVHRDQPIATATQRLQMLKAAIADNPQFRVDDRELQQDRPSYTLHTLQSLREELGEQPVCLLMGGDAWAGFEQWHEPEQIRRLAHIVVMQRPGESAVADTTSSSDALRNKPGGEVIHIPVTQLDISSSSIRERLAAGRSVRYLVPDVVAQYINSMQLYS